MIRFLKKQPPGRLIALGFAAVILIGSALLMLPISIRPGVEVAYIDALFTSTSAVCVTGLIAVDAYDNFTVFGQAVLAGLIQIGGLGVTSVGVGLILAAGRRVSIKGRSLVKEALNVDSFQGMVRLIQWVLKVTLCFEGAGAVLSFLTFSQDYPLPRALWTSVFHSVAAFNNSGFDHPLSERRAAEFGHLRPDHLRRPWLSGDAGHPQGRELPEADLPLQGGHHHHGGPAGRGHPAAEGQTWLGAFFHSVSARTAGFSTYSMGELTNAGLFTLILLMFIGASPGSTGGGIKTTTFFALMQQVRAVFTKKKPGGFHRTLPGEAIDKAGVIALLSVVVVCVGTFLLCVLEPELDFVRLLFEEVSAFGTVGLSTGITPDLSVASKLVLILTMYIGRLGAFTLFSLWIDRPDPSIRYTEEMITIG